MYALYLLASCATFYYIYKKINNLLTVSKYNFEDSLINCKNAKIDFIDITFEDYTREFIEDSKDFTCIISKDKEIKYVTVNYYIDDNIYSILFNKQNVCILIEHKFPFYNNIEKLPLYREVKEAFLVVGDIEHDITDILVDFAGPKLNYHSDIVDIYFEEIIDYSRKFPELISAKGIINIEDNFGDKYFYKYPGKFTWKENILS